MILKRKTSGFTMIEIVIVIILVGIIGSLAATMLFQGSEIFVSETNRQSFVSESRSAFWRTMRSTQGQMSPENFQLSDQNSLYITNAKNEQMDFQTGSSGYFNLRLGNGSYNTLSNSISDSNSNGFSFYNNSFGIISPSTGGLSLEQAKSVHLSKLEFTFINDTDTLSLGSYILSLIHI